MLVWCIQILISISEIPNSTEHILMAHDVVHNQTVEMSISISTGTHQK
jgi:hypothetical protein